MNCLVRLLLSLLFLFHSSYSFAVTDFIVNVNKTGEDYNSVSLAESALDDAGDLTANDIKVFNGTKTGTISDLASVTLYRGGSSQSVTGTVIHTTSSQVLVDSISNTSFTYQTNDEWRVDASNKFTISSTGDSPRLVIYMNDDDGDLDDRFDLNGFTTNATNNIVVTAPVGERHAGKYEVGSGKGASMVTSVNTVAHAKSSVGYSELSWIQFSCSQSADYQAGTIEGFDTVHNIIGRRTGSYTCGGINLAGNYGRTRYVYRNILFNLGQTGIYMNYDTIYVYDNTIQAGACSVYLYNYGLSVTLKNNTMNNYCVSGGGLAASATNLTNDATSPDGASYQNKTPTFVDSASGDYHLASGDTYAKDTGTDLGSSYNQDIDAQTVSGTWDIGADEYQVAATDVFSGRGTGRGIGRGIGR